MIEQTVVWSSFAVFTVGKRRNFMRFPKCQNYSLKIDSSAGESFDFRFLKTIMGFFYFLFFIFLILHNSPCYNEKRHFSSLTQLFYK